MSFPATRLRRIRQHSRLPELVRETHLAPGHLIQPYFVVPGRRVKRPIATLPGHFHWSPDRLASEVPVLRRLGVPAVLLFGVPRKKDAQASWAYADAGPVQEAIRQLKARDPNLVVMTDVCLCAYTSHGHCGVLNSTQYTVHSTQKKNGHAVRKAKQMADIDNDATLELLARTAVSHAAAGADLVAPSDMMDGRVSAIRTALDAQGHAKAGILSYAAKYASSFYGPFRDAAHSTPQQGDRRSYQMDMHNRREALREVALDIEEGADIVMVKPAMPYLDVIAAVRERFPVPIAAYQVSGEFAMLKAASAQRWMEEPRAMLESLTAIRRAGADLIVTYFAQAAARQLQPAKRRRG